MKKIKLLIMLILASSFSTCAFGAQTTSQYFTGTLLVNNSVVFTGGSTTAAINVDTGVLNGSFSPSFRLNTNVIDDQSLALTVTANTQSGTQNAIFNVAANKYVILTNSNVLPPVNSLTNIKTGSPTAANNPNAIAYAINDPVAVPGRLIVGYNTIGKYWDMSVSQNGNTDTSITVPGGAPFNNTYSFHDEPGNYQATVTLSFI